MFINKIVLSKFKKIKYLEVDIDNINVVVGGNNAGKSSLLQGVHFSLTVAMVQKEQGLIAFPQNELLYCPSQNFIHLRHGGDYLNRKDYADSYLKLYAKYDGDQISHLIKIRKGRNKGNIACEPVGTSILRSLINDPKKLFSIYAPGLAGISQEEERRTIRVVRSGVASGDANLYLRNVICQNHLEHLNPTTLVFD